MKKVISLLVFLHFSLYNFAQYQGNERDTLSCNKIKAIIHPRATQYFDASSDYNSFFYPADLTLSTLFTQVLWVGGLSDQDTLYLAAERYNQDGHDFWSGPYTNPSNYVVAHNYFRTWKVTKEQIVYHNENYSEPSYIMPEDIESWPAHGNQELGMAENLAEFVDFNENRVYDPENGDYPLIKGDVSVFYMINDNQAHTETNGRIMGVEIQALAWAYNSGKYGEAYDHSIFLSYKVINRSTKDYHDTYIGVFTDFDIGDAHDDYIGCNVEHGYFYAYNGDDYDTFYRDSIPVQASAILSGPFMDEDNMDNPSGECDESINGSGFGDDIVDNERMGFKRFVYFNNQGSSATTDPHNAIDYYNYMKGFWKDGTSILYGGNGHISGGAFGPETCFVYPGDSDPCNWGTNGEEPLIVEIWNEQNVQSQAGDRRGLASMGPFTFEAGSTEYIDMVLVTAPYTDEKSSKDLLQDYITEIKNDYLEDPLNFGFQYIGVEELVQYERLLEIYPNPVDGDQIWFELDELTEAEYVIYNSAGQHVQSGSLPVQKKQQLNVGSLNSGWYLLEINTESKTYRSKLII